MNDELLLFCPKRMQHNDATARRRDGGRKVMENRIPGGNGCDDLAQPKDAGAGGGGSWLTKVEHMHLLFPFFTAMLRD